MVFLVLIFLILLTALIVGGIIGVLVNLLFLRQISRMSDGRRQLTRALIIIGSILLTGVVATVVFLDSN